MCFRGRRVTSADSSGSLTDSEPPRVAGELAEGGGGGGTRVGGGVQSIGAGTPIHTLCTGAELHVQYTERRPLKR